MQGYADGLDAGLAQWLLISVFILSTASYGARASDDEVDDDDESSESEEESLAHRVEVCRCGGLGSVLSLDMTCVSPGLPNSTFMCRRELPRQAPVSHSRGHHGGITNGPILFGL